MGGLVLRAIVREQVRGICERDGRGRDEGQGEGGRLVSLGLPPMLIEQKKVQAWLHEKRQVGRGGR